MGTGSFFLIKSGLLDPKTQVDFFETRYPALQVGVKISLLKQSGQVLNYTVIARKGPTLYLSFGDASPEDDIELSLLNLEKMAQVKCYDTNQSIYQPLDESHHSTSLINYALVSNNLTLFLHFTV